MARLRYYKRIKVAPGLRLNLSRSGISRSYSVGRFTRNSRGRNTFHLFGGLSVQGGRRRPGNRGVTSWGTVAKIVLTLALLAAVAAVVLSLL